MKAMKGIAAMGLLHLAGLHGPMKTQAGGSTGAPIIRR